MTPKTDRPTSDHDDHVTLWLAGTPTVLVLQAAGVAVLASTSALRYFPAGAVALSPLATWDHGCSLQVNICAHPRPPGPAAVPSATLVRPQPHVAPHWRLTHDMKAHTTGHRRKLHRWDHATCRLQFVSRQASRRGNCNYAAVHTCSIVGSQLLGSGNSRPALLLFGSYGLWCRADALWTKSTPELMKRLTARGKGAMHHPQIFVRLFGWRGDGFVDHPSISSEKAMKKELLRHARISPLFLSFFFGKQLEVMRSICWP